MTKFILEKAVFLILFLFFLTPALTALRAWRFGCDPVFDSTMDAVFCAVTLGIAGLVLCVGCGWI